MKMIIILAALASVSVFANEAAKTETTTAPEMTTTTETAKTTASTTKHKKVKAAKEAHKAVKEAPAHTDATAPAAHTN